MIKNTMERRATLIVDMLLDQANRMVEVMGDEPPPGAVEPTTDQVRRMWDFSPYPNPERTFWGLHDLIVQPLLAQIPPNTPLEDRKKLVQQAHQQAESQAMDRVYPQRGQLVMLGVTTIERSIELAAHAKRLSDRQSPTQKQQSQGAPAYAANSATG